MDAASTYYQDMMKPLLSMCGGAGAFWAKEKRWPVSMVELASLEFADEGWKESLSRFSDVVFTPQPDGSVTVSGTMSPPTTFGGLPVKAGPITFDARITMQRDPDTASGWKPRIDAGFARSEGQPDQLSE